MATLADRIRTLRRIVRTQGLGGLTATLAGRATPLVREVSVGPKVLAARRRHGRPRLVLSFRGGIGDDLLCTAILRELTRRRYDRVWMLSEWPDLFTGNPDAATVLPWDRHYNRWIRWCGWRRINPSYFRFDPAEDRSVLLAPERHMITTMCQQVGIVGPVARRPYLHLQDTEREAGALVPAQVVIQSSGLVAGTPMLNKQWFLDRFQAVVSASRTDFNFVQVGASSDPPLAGVLDLRGRTSRRETAAILSRSVAFVGNAGFLMHAARAVECRSVIVYGGRERPEQTGYSCNENLASDVPCSPCWRRNSCAYDRQCMRQIGPSDVVEGLRRVMARQGTPLEVDTDVIAAERFEPAETPGGRPMMTIATPFGTRRIEAKILADV